MKNKKIILPMLERALTLYKISLFFWWFPLIPILLRTDEGFCYYFKKVLLRKVGLNLNDYDLLSDEDLALHSEIIDILRYNAFEDAENKTSNWFPLYYQGINKECFTGRIRTLESAISDMKQWKGGLKSGLIYSDLKIALKDYKLAQKFYFLRRFLNIQYGFCWYFLKNHIDGIVDELEKDADKKSKYFVWYPLTKIGLKQRIDNIERTMERLEKEQID